MALLQSSLVGVAETVHNAGRSGMPILVVLLGEVGRSGMPILVVLVGDEGRSGMPILVVLVGYVGRSGMPILVVLVGDEGRSGKPILAVLVCTGNHQAWAIQALSAGHDNLPLLYPCLGHVVSFGQLLSSLYNDRV